MSSVRHAAALAALTLLSPVVFALPAAARPTSPPAAPQPPPPTPAQIAPDGRDTVLGPGWQNSIDRAWSLSGDSTGLHVLVARASEGYTWRTAATLSEPGLEADQWIGNACVTASGRRLAVAYGPRTFTNNGILFSRGAFTAIVNLDTGRVTKLPQLSTFAYYSPSCGTGESAVFTQAAGDRQSRTRLIRVDAATGKAAGAAITLDGQVTSAVPVGSVIIAADRQRIVRIQADGRRTTVARTRAVPFRLTATGDGGLTYLDRSGADAYVEYLSAPSVRSRRTTRPATLAVGQLTALDLTRDAQGRAYVTGVAHALTSGPSTAITMLGVPKGSEVSTLGQASITATWSSKADPRIPIADPATPRRVDVAMRIRSTGKSVTLTVAPAGTLLDSGHSGQRAHPSRATTGGGSLAATGSPTNPVEAERTCAVPRNDARNQVMQPKPRQVEWAVDQAVRNVLTVQREANWKNLGMPAYTPQGLFPPLDLYGGGYVPAQVMLGIAAQESNLWQANGRALPGVTSNPLIGNFYGRDIYNDTTSDDWDIHWDEADCGYGVMQITDGMRLATPGGAPTDRQRAIALDFAANIAAGLQILQTKWNQTRAAGMYVNNGDPKFIENWFFAIWAYNSGFHPDLGDGSPWGVGWLNNPANPHYPANRDAFVDKTMADAAKPQYWPYQEKVLGFAGHPLDLPEAPDVMVAAFRPAVWNGGNVQGPINRTNVKPPVNLFCDATNDCVPGATITPDAPDVAGEPAGPCAHKNNAGQYDLRCWYHKPAVWKTDCVNTCGYELLRFDPGYAYQADGASYTPRCDNTGLPAGARIIDNLPDGTSAVRPNCARFWNNAGTFNLTFAADSTAHYASKIDFHQFGAGFGGHFYSAHTRGPSYPGGADKLTVTGTWKLATAMHGWTRVAVSLPDTGATTRQAKYVINLGNGQTRYRVINQRRAQNTWFELGIFPIDGIPSISLSTATHDGLGHDSIVFDAVALTPAAKPSANYVALGDSYSSGEGLSPYMVNTDTGQNSSVRADACHRSVSGAYPTQVLVPGQNVTVAAEAAAGRASFAFLACSGATTVDVAPEAFNEPPQPSDLDGHTDWARTVGDFGEHYGQHGELPQVEQGYLDAETTLVTLTIGGNDARFSEIMRSCIMSLDSCFADGHVLTRDNGVQDPNTLRIYEKYVLRELLPKHLLATYRAIHSRAPNARIIVLGYPQLFNDRNWDNNCVLLSTGEMAGLNTFADLLNVVIARAVSQVHGEGADIRFTNTTQRWRDSHANWACEPWTDPWVNSGILSCSSNLGTQMPCPASFHPTLNGQRQLAGIVNITNRGVSQPAAVKQRILNYVATRTPDNDRWIVTDAQAASIAAECLRLTRVGGVLGDPCMTMPMIMVTANDAAGPAQNDANAIERIPWWVQLNYTSSELREQVVPRDWYNQLNYKPNDCSANPKPTGYQCDEYPFYSSELGVAFDPYDGYDSESSSRAKWTDPDENGTEGKMLGAMYNACGVASSQYAYDTSLMVLGDPFLTIPVLSSDSPRTFYVC